MNTDLKYNILERNTLYTFKMKRANTQSDFCLLKLQNFASQLLKPTQSSEENFLLHSRFFLLSEFFQSTDFLPFLFCHLPLVPAFLNDVPHGHIAQNLVAEGIDNHHSRIFISTKENYEFDE